MKNPEEEDDIVIKMSQREDEALSSEALSSGVPSGQSKREIKQISVISTLSSQKDREQDGRSKSPKIRIIPIIKARPYSSNSGGAVPNLNPLQPFHTARNKLENFIQHQKLKQLNQ